MSHAPKLCLALLMALLAGCASQAPAAAPTEQRMPMNHKMPDGSMMTDGPAMVDAAPDKPVSFKDEVVPVLRNHCAACHTAGGPGAPSVTMFDAAGNPQYENVKDKIGWMLLAIQSGRMPKDKPNSLTKEEFDKLDYWSAALTPNN